MGRRKLVDLLAQVEDFWPVGYLVWSSKDRKLAHADFEHEELTMLCTWDEFMLDPAKWINTLPT